MKLTFEKINKIKKEYNKNGFVLIKNFLPKNKCKKALNWLNKKNKKKLAKTWTEQEPGVDLAVYFVVHKKNSILASIAKNKKVLDLVDKLVEDKVYIYSSKVNLKAAGWSCRIFSSRFSLLERQRLSRNDMLSAMVFLEKHNDENAPLKFFQKLINLFYQTLRL